MGPVVSVRVKPTALAFSERWIVISTIKLLIGCELRQWVLPFLLNRTFIKCQFLDC